MKGETLQIKSASTFNFIPNRGVYVVPSGEGYVVGATYSYHDQLPESTPAARAELIDKTSDLLAEPFEVSGQNWGFRPTTPDRKPILGRHPKYPQLIFFNGLGTKGVSLAPAMAKSLINCLENDMPINKVTDISRYYSLYSGFTS
jgi:glycine/D-amino acid oxidase-like deaminating enzyme